MRHHTLVEILYFKVSEDFKVKLLILQNKLKKFNNFFLHLS